MTENIFEIKRNIRIAKDIYEMMLSGDTSSLSRPGQFVNIKVPEHFLRRPISVCDYSDNSLTLIYKTVGDGTKKMQQLECGEKLSLLVGLGNGYDTSKSGTSPLLIGGGVGIPPLYGLAKKLIYEGKKVSAVLGFNSCEEIFYKEKFEQLGVETFITTVDGSAGTKGFVTDVIDKINYTYFYTCGPMAMMKAIEGKATTSGQYSFEERMGCGFGACMGCSCRTMLGNKRVCVDGPVFEREEIIWQI